MTLQPQPKRRGAITVSTILIMIGIAVLSAYISNNVAKTGYAFPKAAELRARTLVSRSANPLFPQFNRASTRRLGVQFVQPIPPAKSEKLPAPKIKIGEESMLPPALVFGERTAGPDVP